MSTIVYNNLATYFEEPGETGSCPLVKADGRGTRDEPLRLSLVMCHAVMGSEEPAGFALAQESLADTSSVLDVLHHGLSSLEIHGDEPPTQDALSLMKQVLEDANATALGTDKFYSAAAAILSGRRLVVVGVGHVTIWSWRGGAFVEELSPTIMPVTGLPQAQALLTAALGLGFDSSKVQACEILLESGEFVAFAVEAEMAQASDSSARRAGLSEETSEELLNFVASQFDHPPLLAVLRTGSD